MAVSMQTPIPDYGDFGKNITASWLAGKELALAGSKFEQNKKVQDAQLDMQQRESDYQWNVREAQNKIAQEKYGLALEKEDIRRNYMDDLQAGGKYDPNFGHRVLETLSLGGYDADWSEEEWAKDKGITIPTNWDLLSTLDPSSMTRESLAYARNPDLAIEGSEGGSATDLLALSGLGGY